ncbi:hypothetical protein [Streptomyces sp. NBC_00503]|uniref:hypothetical protein n=1 Tax=Streptomyces sp. NBC_00503 TaxID=2903659 RepID=UPI002E7FB4C2|nr:hypothetical protein [Streptomyces sp. NBC_00503]WUD86444.1 hypothetical protein OG490_38185 [Streptomyces sp. NBC_00503]
MIEIGVLLGVMVLAAAWMVKVVLRRGKRRTENVEGLLIESAHTAQAREDRSTYNAASMHGSTPQQQRFRP